MKQKALALVLGLVLITAISGCSEKPTEPADLLGEWAQTNSSSKTSYHIATIESDTIEIYWFDAETDTKSLYWAGTFKAPETADEPYKWASANDKEKTEFALMASGEGTKEFAYKGGVLSYSASALGVTQAVKLEKQK